MRPVDVLKEFQETIWDRDSRTCFAYLHLFARTCGQNISMLEYQTNIFSVRNAHFQHHICISSIYDIGNYEYLNE